VLKSWETYEWVMSQRLILRRMGSFTAENGFCYCCYASEIANVLHKQVQHMNESCHRCVCIIAHMWRSHVTHRNELFRFHRAPKIANVLHSHVPHMSHTWTSHMRHTHDWVMSQMWVSRLCVSHIWTTSHATHMDELFRLLHARNIASQTQKSRPSYVTHRRRSIYLCKRTQYTYKTALFLRKRALNLRKRTLYLRPHQQNQMSRMSNRWMSHVTHRNESCRSYE